MNSAQALTYYAQKLQAIYDNPQTATTVTWWLLEKALQKNRAELLLGAIVPAEAQKLIESWISDMVNSSKPVQYILGSVPFLELDILVEAPLLIPRPETEEWCNNLIIQIKKTGIERFTLLDMCSGTGCIALSIAHAFPQATITASDISPAACQLIKRNKEKNGLKNCTVIESDLFKQIGRDKKYSIVTANPPYISADEWVHLEDRVKMWESPQALVAENNGLGIIEKIISTAPDYLEIPIGTVASVWIEIGSSQAQQVSALFTQSGYQASTVYQDFYGKNRLITGIL